MVKIDDPVTPVVEIGTETIVLHRIGSIVTRATDGAIVGAEAAARTPDVATAHVLVLLTKAMIAVERNEAVGNIIVVTIAAVTETNVNTVDGHIPRTEERIAVDSAVDQAPAIDSLNSNYRN